METRLIYHNLRHAGEMNEGCGINAANQSNSNKRIDFQFQDPETCSNHQRGLWERTSDTALRLERWISILPRFDDKHFWIKQKLGYVDQARTQHRIISLFLITWYHIRMYFLIIGICSEKYDPIFSHQATTMYDSIVKIYLFSRNVVTLKHYFANCDLFRHLHLITTSFSLFFSKFITNEHRIH